MKDGAVYMHLLVWAVIARLASELLHVADSNNSEIAAHQCSANSVFLWKL